MVQITNDFAPHGRNLGNKLFTYAVARIVAEKLNYKFDLPENCNIQRNGIITEFPFKGIDGKIVNSPELYISDHNLCGKSIEFILEEGKNKKVFFDGYFLKYEYIKNYKKEIKNFYSDLIENLDESSNDVIILLRDSNCDHTFKLPDSYYTEILERINFERLFVSFDHKEKHQSLFKKIEKYNPIFLDLDILELFKNITSKKTIISCQGTFAFWVSFLSNSKKIYWPITNIGPNKLTDPLVDLYVDDDERYEFINLHI